MTILSGNEYLCLQEADQIIRLCDNPMAMPYKHILRSSQQEIPEDSRAIVITVDFVHKKNAQTFDHIKVGEESKLKQVLGPHCGYINNVPIAEFKDLKNSQYTVWAYDLMSFYHSVLPVLLSGVKLSKATQINLSTFEFTDLFLSQQWEQITKYYGFVIEDNNESYWWMLENTLGVCMKILSKDTVGIHSYRILKCTPFARKLGYERLLKIRQFVLSMITLNREQAPAVEKWLLFMRYADYAV